MEQSHSIIDYEKFQAKYASGAVRANAFIESVEKIIPDVQSALALMKSNKDSFQSFGDLNSLMIEFKDILENDGVLEKIGHGLSWDIKDHILRDKTLEWDSIKQAFPLNVTIIKAINMIIGHYSGVKAVKSDVLKMMNLGLSCSYPGCKTNFERAMIECYSQDSDRFSPVIVGLSAVLADLQTLKENCHSFLRVYDMVNSVAETTVLAGDDLIALHRSQVYIYNHDPLTMKEALENIKASSEYKELINHKFELEGILE